MCHIIEMAFLAAVAVVIGMNIHVLLSYRRFLSCVQHSHPDYWATIGRPVLSDDSLSTFPFTSYFFGKQYESLGDLEVSRLGNQTRRSVKVVLASSALLLLAFAATQSIGSPWDAGACWFLAKGA